MALPEVLPKNGNEVPWKEGQCRQTPGETGFGMENPMELQGTCHPWALITASPTLAPLCDPVCPFSNPASHSQLFCLCASSLHSLRFYSTHHILLSSLKLILVHLTGKGHVDPAQALNDRSCPHTINTPKARHFPGYNAFIGQKSLSVLTTPNIQYVVVMIILVILLSPSA